jgi:hypothetical protein
MKTKFNILGIITVLLYSCQDRPSLIEDNSDSDSVMTATNIEQQTLRKCFSFNKESESIITSAELILSSRNKK